MTAEQAPGLSPRPHVPEIPAGTTVVDAALLYAAAGWFVVPVDPQTKNPGSRLGRGWQLQTSRDPATITAWWQRWPEASVALHVGRSGAVCLDVDDPSKLSPVLSAWLVSLDDPTGPLDAQFQSTRVGEQGRGHYLFGADPGAYGNSVSGFREAGLDGWGEVRGLNAVIVVEPSVHTKPGGQYRWATTGPLPEVPEGLAALLRPPGAVGGPAVDNAELNAFLADLPGPEACPVVQAARDDAVDTLGAMDPGGRHDYMLTAVMKLVRLGEQGHHGAAGALEEVFHAFLASKPEAGGSEYHDAVSGAVRGVLAQQTLPDQTGCCPSWLQERWMQAMGFTPPPSAQPVADGVVVVGPWQEPQPQARLGAGKFGDNALSETFAAEALVGRYRWAAGLKWLHWTGNRWERVHDSAIIEQARLWTLGHVQAAVALAAQSQDGDDTEIKAWLAVGKSAGRLRALAQLAQGIPGIATKASLFDADPDILNCSNGVVHLPSGTLLAPDPRRLVTKLAPVDYVPGAWHTDWNAALEALPADERQWLQLRLGQGVSGHTPPDDLMVICQGGGENGKSTLFDAVTAALGDYHVQLADRVLTASPDAHPTELMDLRGARLATIEETPEARQLNVVRLKKSVGSSHITARYIAQDSVTYAATHTLFVSTNYRPIVAETDHGTWRRLALLRFPYTFQKPHEPLVLPTDRRGDPGLKARVKTDPAVHTAVLAWLVDGAWAWYNSGRRMPAPAASVTAETDAWRADSDVVYSYWAERVEPAPGYAVLASELLQDFNEWAARTKQQQAWSDRTFKSRFGDHQATQAHGVQHRRVNRWSGDPELSRPDTGYGYGHSQVPRDPVLWVGMRFSTGNQGPVDNHKTPGQTASAHAAHASPDGSKEKYLHENRPEYRAQRAQNSNRTDVRSQNDAEQLGGDATQSKEKPLTKAQLARAEEKALKVSEAAGPEVELPAVVLRDGTAAPVTLAEADMLLQGLPRVTVDVETSGHPVGHREYELRTVQLGDADVAVVLDPAVPSQRHLIRHTLAVAPRLGAHSATADIVPLAVADLGDFDAMWEAMDDTVIAAKLHDPQSTGSDPGLKDISAYMLGDASASTPADAGRKALFKAAGWLEKPKPDTPPERNGWHQVNPRCTTMVRYAGSDVLDTGMIADRMPGLPPHLAERERAVAHTVSRIALVGVPIDGDRVGSLMAHHTERRADYAERLRNLYGIENVGSDRQVAQVLTDLGVRLPYTEPSTKFPQGQPSVAAGVLDTLRAEYHDNTAEAVLMDDVLAWRHHDTAITSFLTPYSQLVLHGDGRARPTVYTLAADTGRMSCVRPNFQQLPREGGIRSIITADPGYSLISADFSSVEIRVAAALSGDQALMRMLDEGLDPHAMAAAIVYGPDFTKAQRYAVKRGVFGRIYGGGVKTLAKQMGVPLHVAQQLIDAIDRLWPRLAQWSRDLTAAVQSGLQTTFETYSGRIIHLPKKTAYAAPNYAIQGTARELEVDAILRWRETRWGNSVMWPVHDENDAMVRTEEADDATDAMVRCMTSELHGVAITVEASEPSTFWRDSA